METNDLTRYVHLFEGSYSAFLDLDQLVSHAWNLKYLKALYSEFLARHEPVLKRWKKDDLLTDRDAFIDVMRLVSEWRRLPYMDPGLPSELLPKNWEAERARPFFNELRSLIEMRAFKRVMDVVGG